MSVPKSKFVGWHRWHVVYWGTSGSWTVRLGSFIAHRYATTPAKWICRRTGRKRAA